jgi:hypothetical protein
LLGRLHPTASGAAPDPVGWAPQANAESLQEGKKDFLPIESNRINSYKAEIGTLEILDGVGLF